MVLERVRFLVNIFDGMNGRETRDWREKKGACLQPWSQTYNMATVILSADC
jgi:hypothetical protein